MAASAVPASSPVIRCTSAWPGHDALVSRSSAAIEQARRPAQRRRPRVRVRLAPALIRSTVRAIEPIALANSPNRSDRHISGHRGGVGADPVGAQQLRGGRLGWPQKRLIQPRERIVAAPGGDLHQRGRVRNWIGQNRCQERESATSRHNDSWPNRCRNFRNSTADRSPPGSTGSRSGHRNTRRTARKIPDHPAAPTQLGPATSTARAA